MVCGYPIGSSSLVHLNLVVFIGWFCLWVLVWLLLVCVSGKGCFVCNYGGGGSGKISHSVFSSISQYLL